MKIQSYNNIFPDSVVAYTNDHVNDDFAVSLEIKFPSKQRNRVASALGQSPAKFVGVKQVHGTDILVLKEDCSFDLDHQVEADGVLTDVHNLPITIRTADCLPVFLCDPVHNCIGLIHAGWRGSSGRIVEKAVRTMGRIWGSNPEDLLAQFGPAIHTCCYEVSVDFFHKFPYTTKQVGDKYCFDLPQENKNQLMNIGVQEDHILENEHCTCCEKQYFSFRRQGDAAGRMVSVMMLK